MQRKDSNPLLQDQNLALYLFNHAATRAPDRTRTGTLLLERQASKTI